MDVFEAGYLRLLVCVMGLDKTPDPLCAYIFCKKSGSKEFICIALLYPSFQYKVSPAIVVRDTDKIMSSVLINESIAGWILFFLSGEDNNVACPFSRQLIISSL